MSSSRHRSRSPPRASRTASTNTPSGDQTWTASSHLSAQGATPRARATNANPSSQQAHSRNSQPPPRQQAPPPGSGPPPGSYKESMTEMPDSRAAVSQRNRRFGAQSSHRATPPPSSARAATQLNQETGSYPSTDLISDILSRIQHGPDFDPILAQSLLGQLQRKTAEYRPVLAQQKPEHTVWLSEQVRNADEAIVALERRLLRYEKERQLKTARGTCLQYRLWSAGLVKPASSSELEGAEGRNLTEELAACRHVVERLEEELRTL